MAIVWLIENQYTYSFLLSHYREQKYFSLHVFLINYKSTLSISNFHIIIIIIMFLFLFLFFNSRYIYTTYSTDQNYRTTLLVHYSLLVYLSALEMFYYNSLSNIDFDLLFQNILRRDSNIM
jgi:hypothetical protein